MPSFDIISQVNMQEVDNAVNQTVKEISARYDFKGSKSQITKDKESISLLSDDNFRMNAVIDILKTKWIKRGIDLKAINFGKIETAHSGLVKCLAKIVSGVPQEKAKELLKIIKDLNLKVQASIAGDQVRVSGKNRDDLQAVIAHLKTVNFDIPLQFSNYRD